MKNFIFGIGIGALLGCGATYLYLKTKHEKSLEEEIASIKEYYKDKEEFDSIQLERKIKDTDKKVVSYEEALKASQQNNERMQRIVTGIVDKEGYWKYHDIDKRLDIEDVDVELVETTVTSSDEYIELDEEIVEGDDSVVERPNWTEVFEVLDENSFDLDYYDYDKVNLVYYAKEDILVTEDDEILDDAIMVLGELGMMALASYDVEIDDGDSIYIRNNVRDSDYAVLYQEHSYFEDNAL